MSDTKEPIVLRNTVRVHVAAWLLRMAERLYVWAHGWKRNRAPHLSPSHAYWEPPTDYPFERKSSYELRHAVNAQRAVYGHATYQARMGFRP